MKNAPTETMVTPLFLAFENPSLLFCFVSTSSARTTASFLFFFSILPVIIIILNGERKWKIYRDF